jgi:hypothetical protein
MSGRRLNPRLPKIHRTYTVEEAAKLFQAHRKTVRQWIKQGLPTVDSKRPTLILGRDLAAFLRDRRATRRRPCGPGEIYCVRCRIPRRPAGDMAEYQALTATSGNLMGLCPTCEAFIYRRVNRSKLEQVRGHLEVTFTQAPAHISESACPSVNVHLSEVDDDAVTQPQ